MTAELLFFRIKTHIKLKKTNQAKEDIQRFINLYPESDYYSYIIFEKNLLEINNAK